LALMILLTFPAFSGNIPTAVLRNFAK